MQIVLLYILIACHNKSLKLHSRWYGGDRPRWLGPIPFDYPSYLRGQLPGDYGFDLAGLGKDPDALQKYYKYSFLLFIITFYVNLILCLVRTACLC